MPGTDAEAEGVWAATARIQGAELRFSEKGARDDAQRALGHPWSSGQLWMHGFPVGNRRQQAHLFLRLYAFVSNHAGITETVGGGPVPREARFISFCRGGRLRCW